jgi:hypothetical protein
MQAFLGATQYISLIGGVAGRRILIAHDWSMILSKMSRFPVQGVESGVKASR